MLGNETKLGTRLECLAGFSDCADQAVKQDFCKKSLPIIEFITTVRRSFFFVGSLKRGNRHHFFGGTENPLSRVVAAQHIVEVTFVKYEHDPHLQSDHLAVRLRFELT